MPYRLTNLLRMGLAAMLAVASLTGCVQRRMTIRSNPPGAQVYVDGYEVGTTPCSTSFTYYGTREITLVKDGFETLKVDQQFPLPWYQYPPIDFVAENLWPYETRDERSLVYTMQAQAIVPTEQLLGRAEDLRRATQAQHLGTPGGIPPGAIPTGPPVATPPSANPAETIAPAVPGGPETLPPGGQAASQFIPPPQPGTQTLPPGGVKLDGR